MVSMRRMLTAGLLTLLAGVPAAGAQADDTGARSGLVTAAGDAAASGVRFTYEVPAEFLAASTPFDGGGPVAQASIGSGLARSAASLPFPGDVVIAGPGLFYTVSGITLPGSYPFYVAAEYPTAPESKLADPSGQYRLSAGATDHSASSVAQAVFGPSGQGSGGSRTTTSIETQPDGSAIARAESVSEALALGEGVLKIASVRSTSVTELAAGAMEAVTKRSLSVEGATVAGQPVTIDAGGIHAGTGTAPIPFGSGADQVSTALAQSGLSARVLREDDGAGGSSEVLQVQSRHPLPFAGNPEGVFSWRIGKVTSSLVRTGFLPAPKAEATSDMTTSGSTTSAPADGLPPGDPGASAPGRSLGPVPAVAHRGPGAAVLPAGYEPGPVADVFASAPAVPSATAGEPQSVTAAPVAARAVPAVASRAVGLSRMRSIYGGVALGALLIAVLAGVWSKKGVSWPPS
jgi:hypothetical protein